MERRRKIVTLQRWNLANTILNQRVRTNINRDKSVIVYALDKMWYEWYFIPVVFIPGHAPNILTQSDHEKTITQIPHEAAAVLCLVISNSLWSPWADACQAPLSMEFSRQENWRGLPFSIPGHLLDPGIEPTSLASLALAGRFFTTVPPGKLPTWGIFYKVPDQNPQSYEVYLKQGVWEAVTTKRRSCDGKRRVGKNWGSHIKNGCHVKRMHQDWFMNCDKYITFV